MDVVNSKYMRRLMVIIKKPIISYFILTFIISWSGIIIVSFFTGMPAPSKTFESIAPIAMLPLVIGPTIASLLLSGINYGKSGLMDLLSKLLKWKVGIQWYIFALLTFPIIASVSLFSLSLYSSDFLPNILTSNDKTGLLLTGLLVGIFLTLFEEIGWSGFALPELNKRYSVLTTGLLLGAIWGVWHFLPVFYGCGDESGNFNFQLFYPGFFFHYAGLIPFRILMTWLYKNTDSILLPWIMHATLTSCAFFILNISKTGLPLLIYYVALSLLLWISVFVVVKKRSYIQKENS